MAEGQQQNRAPRKMNAFSEYSFRLVADPLPNEKRGPTLGFSVVKNKPQIEVRTNLTNDKDYGRITAKLDTPTFYAMLADLRKIADGPADVKRTLSINNFRFINGKRSENAMLDAKVVYGKDKDGVVFIGVVSWETSRPIIKFIFRPSQHMHLANGDGTPASMAEISVSTCHGWIDAVSDVTALILVNEYVEPPPREDNRGGGGGYGGGQQRGGGGGYGGGGGGGGYGGGGGGGSSSGSGNDDFPM